MPSATPAEHALHRNFLESLRVAKRGLVRAAFYLTELVDRKVHRVLGYADGVSYAVAVGGLTEGQARDLLRMGRKMRALPELAEAVERGTLSWGKARLLSPHATHETVAALVQCAQIRSERELQADLRLQTTRLAAGTAPEMGFAPADKPAALQRAVAPPDSTAPQRAAAPPAVPPHHGDAAPCPATVTHMPPERRHVVSLAFDAAGYAEWEARVANLRRDGRHDPLGSLHLEALRALADGPQRHDGAAGSDPAVLLVMLHCPDCGAAAWCTSRGELPVARALLEAARCDAIVETDGPSGPTRRALIPPRSRREVLRRDRYRCQAEHCTHTRNLQIHHRVPVAQGGTTEIENLVTLCARCHHRLHERENELQALRPPL